LLETESKKRGIVYVLSFAQTRDSRVRDEESWVFFLALLERKIKEILLEREKFQEL
jgi:hypothetical protein